MGMDGCGTEDHELVGAEFLGKLGFTDTVSYLARHHVNAKRYLCARTPGYMGKLTEASKITLKHQGGPMSEEEVSPYNDVSAANQLRTFSNFNRYARGHSASRSRRTLGGPSY